MAKKITELPPPPQRSQPATFRDRADAMAAGLDQFVDEANALADEAESNALQSETAKNESETARDASRASELGSIAAQGGSEAAAATSKWAAGDYSEGAKVWSPADFMTYRAKVAHTSAADPSQDKTNWQMVGSFPAPFFPESFAEIVGTAVDICIYDTSEDSDGGAWRDRCQHLSWYNEPLNTATRGARRDFPAVAVIVAEADQVVIYDGDDPSLPMWMVFTGNASNNMLLEGPPSSVEMLNGCLLVGHNGAGYDANLVSFLADSAIQYATAGVHRYYNGVVSQRNAVKGWLTDTTAAQAIVNRKINDVAMTVLPGAPIDPVTGLAVPTIAVATEGGISIIRHNGDVIDVTHTSHNEGERVAFSDDGELIYITGTSAQGRWLHVDHEIPSADISKGAGYVGTQSDEMFHGIWGTDYSDESGKLPVSNTRGGLAASPDGMIAVGSDGTTQPGLGLIARNPAQPDQAMTALITSTYLTGWMPCDIKGAWLCDTDDADLVGAELVTNGDFASDVSGWSPNSNAAISHDNGQLKVTATGAGNAQALQVINTVPGRTYVFQADITAQTNTNNLAIQSTGLYAEIGWSPQSRQGHLSFVATDTTATVILYAAPSTGVALFDNVSVRVADPDRSHNGKGLAVHGTITKEPVAPGAELVAYSGFGASNYLEQPYNPDLDFGTGDFCVMGWFWGPSGTTGYPALAVRNVVGGHEGNVGAWNLKIDRPQKKIYWHSGGSNVVVTDNLYLADKLNFVCVNRKNGVLSVCLNGISTEAADTRDYSLSGASLLLGVARSNNTITGSGASMALWRLSGTPLSPDQIRKIYEDEKRLFTDNAACTLYGTSDAVNAIAHDKRTGLLHVGTSQGRSDFQGLMRVDHTTDPVDNAIAAHGGLIVED